MSVIVPPEPVKFSYQRVSISPLLIRRILVRKEIQDMIDKIDRGEPITERVIKMRVPIIDGKEDWDKAETVSVEERTICPKKVNAGNH